MTHEYDEEINAKIEACASCGVPHKMIAKHVGLSVDTMRKYYGSTLETAQIDKICNVAKMLYAKAMDGNVACMTFFLKTQAHWREVDRNDEDGKSAEPVNRIQIEVISPSGTSEASSKLINPSDNKDNK